MTHVPGEVRAACERDWHIRATKNYLLRLHSVRLYSYVTPEGKGESCCDGGNADNWRLPNVTERLLAKRCETCCSALGYPKGVGSPKNSSLCRPLVLARLKALGIVKPDAASLLDPNPDFGSPAKQLTGNDSAAKVPVATDQGTGKGTEVTTGTIAPNTAQAFAQKVGEDPAKVRTVDPRWRDYLTECAAITVHCSRMRAEALLTPDVLGIDTSDDAERKAINNIVQLGYILSLPKHVKLRGQQIENKFRANMRKYTLDTEFGRIVSAKRYPEWRKNAEQIRAEYMSFAEWVAAHWDELRNETARDLWVLGIKNYRLLTLQGRRPFESGLAVPESEWVTDFVTRSLSKLGTREQWLAQARMWWNVGYVPLATQMNSPLWAQDHSKTALQQDVMSQAAVQQETGLFSFMAECRASISRMIIEVMQDCLDSYRKNGQTINRNSARRLRHLAEKIDGLMFWDDASLSRQMADITSLLDVKPESRDEERLSAVMSEVAKDARSLLVELDVPLSRKAQRTDAIADDFSDMLTINRQSRQMRTDFDDELDISGLKVSRKQAGEEGE